MALDDFIFRFRERETDKGWPRVEDFCGAESRVFVDEVLVESARRTLTRNRICLIRGPEGRGKTVLARSVGNALLKDKWEVLIVDLALMQETAPADHVVGNVETFGWKKEKALIIVENAHRADGDLIARLVQMQWEADFPASLLFTRRWIQGMPDAAADDALAHLIANSWCVSLLPGIGTAERIISKTLPPSYQLDSRDRQWIQEEIGSKPNLRRLRWYLDVWLKDPQRRLSDIRRQEVYDKVHADLVQSVPARYRDALVLLAAVLQLDMSFDSLVLSEEEREILERQRQISGQAFYRMAHASDAGLILEATANNYGEQPEALTERLVRLYVEKGPRNYRQLVRSLLLQENAAIRNALRLKEVAGLLDRAIEDSLSGVLLLLNYLLTTRGAEAAKRFWEEYETKLAETEGSAQIALEALVRGATLPELLLLAGIQSAIARRVCDILEAVCTLDFLFERANGNNLAKVGTFLRNSFLRRTLAPPEPAAQDLAKRVAGFSLRSILQFLHNLRPAIDNAFLAEFFRALSAQPGFHKAMEGYSHRFIRKCRTIILKLDPGIAGYFNDCVSEERESAALLRSSLKRIEQAIVVSLVNGQLTDTVMPKNRMDRIAQYVFRGLSFGDDLEKKAAKSSHPFAHLRSLTYAFASIRMEPAVLGRIMSQIARLFASAEVSCTPEDLFLLLGNLKKLDDGVWKVAATTAARKCDVTVLAKRLDPFGALILWHIRQVDPSVALQMAKEYFARRPCSVLECWRSEGYDGRFAPLLANLSQLDLSATQKWVRTDSSDLWLEQLNNTTADVSVTCLAAMYFVDADLAKELLHKLISGRFAAGVPIKPSELALAGLNARLFNDPAHPANYPSAREIASWFSAKHPFVAWAFAAYAVRQRNVRLLHEALCLAEIYMKNRDIHFSVSEQLEATLHPELRAMLADMLEGITIELTPKARKGQIARQRTSLKSPSESAPRRR